MGSSGDQGCLSSQEEQAELSQGKVAGRGCFEGWPARNGPGHCSGTWGMSPERKMGQEMLQEKTRENVRHQEGARVCETAGYE